MTVKVIKSFRDKHTRKICRAGTTLEVTAARAKEINAAEGGPYVEAETKKE